MAQDSQLVMRYVGYWLATALLFGVSAVLTWGSTPIALVVWSVAALPLAISTRSGLADGGREAPRWAILAVGVVWVLLLVLAVGLVVADAALAPYKEYLQWAAAMFPGAVTAWGVWASTRVQRERDGSLA
jgi:hypothetical protein